MAKNVLKQLVDNYNAVFEPRISITQENKALDDIFAYLDRIVDNDFDKSVTKIDKNGNEKLILFNKNNVINYKTLCSHYNLNKIEYFKEKVVIYANSVPEQAANALLENFKNKYQNLKNKRDSEHPIIKADLNILEYNYFKDSEIVFPTEDEDDIDLVSKNLYEHKLDESNILKIQYVFNVLTCRWAIVFRHNNRGFSFNSLHEVCIFEFDAEDRFYVVHKTLSDPRLTSSSLGKLWDDKLNLIKPDELQNPVLGGSKKKKSAKKFEFF